MTIATQFLKAGEKQSGLLTCSLLFAGLRPFRSRVGCERRLGPLRRPSAVGRLSEIL
jgi:hypothetical protein